MTPFLLWGGIFAPWILLKVELFGFQAASDRAIFWRKYASKYQLFVQFNLTFYKNIKVFFSISTSFFLKDFDWKSYTQSFCKALFLKLINRGTLTILIARIASWDTWSAARCTPNEWRAAKRCGSVRHRPESRKSLLL
jgi:hypothetical protein